VAELAFSPEADQVLTLMEADESQRHCAARLNSAQPIAGINYELDAIAATVIGGTSLMGGEGTLGGTLVGALIMGVLRNGLNLLGVSSFLQQIVIGGVIVVAVLLDTVLKRKHRT